MWLQIKNEVRRIWCNNDVSYLNATLRRRPCSFTSYAQYDYSENEKPDLNGGHLSITLLGKVQTQARRWDMV